MERRSVITALFILIITAFFVWALFPRPDISTQIAEKLKNEHDKADVLFKDATLAEIYDGIKYWELISKTSVINKSTGKADLATVDGLFFDNGLPTLKFIAPTAVWQMNRNEIILKDPIGYDIKYEKKIMSLLAGNKGNKNLASVFHLPEKKALLDGYWFQAKNLDWKLETKKLQCNGSIYLTKGNATITSNKLEADVGLENVRLSENPSAEIKLNGETVMIRADEFLVDSANNTIIAKNNVHVTNRTSVIDTGYCVYDQDKNTILMTGNVQIVDGKVSAYSDKADYDLATKKILLQDNAKAIREGNEIYGQKILLFLGENKIIVQGRTKAKVTETEMK